MRLEDFISDKDLVILDLETTGTSVKSDRIVQFAGVRIFVDGRPRERLVLMVNPQMPIPEGASNVHGITDEMVCEAPIFEQIANKITRFLSDADLGGYNVLAYDLPLLRQEYERCDQSFNLIGRRIIDGMLIFKYFERRDLSSALRFYCNAEHVGAHQALDDVYATIKVVEAQLDRYEDIPEDIAGLAQLSLGRRITPDGRLVWQDEQPCLSFGTHAGVPLQIMVREHRDYLDWILRSDFTDELKDVIRKAYNGEFPSRNAASQ